MISFEEWMREAGKSDKSIRNDTQALTGTLTTMLQDHGIHRGDLLKVADQTAFESIAGIPLPVKIATPAPHPARGCAPPETR